MTKFRIEYDRGKCIGAASCAAIDPEDFEMNADGKADLKGGKDGKLLVKEVDDITKAKPAAESCPADAIRVTDIAKNKRIV